MSCSLRIYLLMVAATSDSQFSLTFPDWLESWTVIEPGFKSRWVEKGWWILNSDCSFSPFFLWHGARDWESQIQVQLIVRKMPSHWAPSEIEPKVPCGTVRESNLGPLCAIPTTLTIQPLRRTKVWPGNQPDVLQSQNLPPRGSRGRCFQSINRYYLAFGFLLLNGSWCFFILFSTLTRM